MPDPLNKSERSRVMSRIRSRGNASTEIKMAKLLRSSGFSGWRRHLSIEGKPDFAFPASKLALFVDGCFWHGCPRCYRAPKSSRHYWQLKIERNRKRDLLVARRLRQAGWKVLRLRECQLMDTEGVLSRLSKALV